MMSGQCSSGQYLSLQPSLDGSHVQVNGRLGPLEAEICRQGLDRRGESLLPAGQARPDAGQRRALALTTLCQDELDRTPQPARTTAERIRAARRRREPSLMIVANQALAETSDYEQGVAVLARAWVGPDTVDLVQCVGVTETIGVRGQDIVLHGSATNIRPSLRRAVLSRDDGCTIDGCVSTYRLEVHHIIPRSHGGTHAADNLTTLCWWHHHVAVHRRGMRIDPQSPPGGDASCHDERPAATSHPTPTHIPLPSSRPYTHTPTKPHPELAPSPAAQPDSQRASR